MPTSFPLVTFARDHVQPRVVHHSPALGGQCSVDELGTYETVTSGFRTWLSGGTPHTCTRHHSAEGHASRQGETACVRRTHMRPRTAAGGTPTRRAGRSCLVPRSGSCGGGTVRGEGFRWSGSTLTIIIYIYGLRRCGAPDFGGQGGGAHLANSPGARNS